MEKPTVEKGIETRFFKRHKRYMPAVLNIKKTGEEEETAVKSDRRQR